jgi:hypothetical protein
MHFLYPEVFDLAVTQYLCAYLYAPPHQTR